MTIKKVKQIPDFYIGIDLGTTNCSAASGNERRDGTFLVDMISFLMVAGRHTLDWWRVICLPSMVGETCYNYKNRSKKINE